MWLKNNATHPLIFCLTSPGFTSIANTTNALSKFFNNARKQGMGEYVWVREHTKRGFPHFHVIADWHPVEHWFGRENGEARVNILSRHWSSYFGSDSPYSVRFGSYHPITKKRTYYLQDDKQAWYLTKYLGKNIGAGSLDYLSEAGFPQLVYKKSVRNFAISQSLGQWSQPVEFESTGQFTYENRIVQTTKGLVQAPVATSYKRVWEHDPDLPAMTFDDSILRSYRWKSTGHGQTYMGYLKKNHRFPGEKNVDSTEIS